MRINEIVWNKECIAHIARHGVEPQEVEEVCFQMKPFIMKAKNNRYFAMGQTCSGRYLAIIFEYLGNSAAKIITARAMSESERKFYQRR